MWGPTMVQISNEAFTDALLGLLAILYSCRPLNAFFDEEHHVQQFPGRLQLCSCNRLACPSMYIQQLSAPSQFLLRKTEMNQC